MTLDEKLDFLYAVHYIVKGEPVVLQTKKDMDIRGVLDGLVDMTVVYDCINGEVVFSCVEKTGIHPLTYYKLTQKGRELFDQYLDFKRI